MGADPLRVCCWTHSLVLVGASYPPRLRCSTLLVHAVADSARLATSSNVSSISARTQGRAHGSSATLEWEPERPRSGSSSPVIVARSVSTDRCCVVRTCATSELRPEVQDGELSAEGNQKASGRHPEGSIRQSEGNHNSTRRNQKAARGQPEGNHTANRWHPPRGRRARGVGALRRCPIRRGALTLVGGYLRPVFWHWAGSAVVAPGILGRAVLALRAREQADVVAVAATLVACLPPASRSARDHGGDRAHVSHGMGHHVVDGAGHILDDVMALRGTSGCRRCP